MAWRSNALACELKDVLNFILKESFQGYHALLKITDQSVCESSQMTQKKKSLAKKSPCKPTRRFLKFYLKRELLRLLRLLRLLMTGPVDNKSQRYLFTKKHDKLYTNYVLIAKLILFVYEGGPANKCATVSRYRT